MIEASALERVDAILGGHVTPHHAVGEIMVASGTITAQSDDFTIRVKGQGGHGARPHESVDAVVVAGLLIMAVQTLVSRETNPVHPSVVTIGKVQAGSASNVIAEEALLQGTIRRTEPTVRQHLIKGLARMTKAIGDLHNATVQVDIKEDYPPVVNTKREATIARRVATKGVGEDGLVEMDYPSMGAEDFSYYLEKVPGCYVRFGACRAGWENIPLHNPSFDFDEDVLKVGATFFDQLVRDAVSEYANDR